MNSLVKMPRYDAYKESGAEWLGDIPASWDLLPNKYIFKLKKNQVGKKSKDFVLLSLTLNGVIERDMVNPQGKFPAEFDTYQEVKPGDFIFCLFDVEETPRAVGLSLFNGMITGAYTVFESKDTFDKNFLYYFYLNLDANKLMKPLYKGLRNTIPKERFFEFKSFIPPHKEQTAIANFLDKKTAQIDQAIAIKEKQIELLKERKQILIQNAVTQGINPKAPMKDSRVEWIGKIPAHWEVMVINYAIDAVGDVDHYMPPTVEEGVPYFMTGDLKEFISIMDFSDCKKVSFYEHKKLTKKIRTTKGDVILARYATIGTATYVDVDKDFLVSYSCVTIKPKITKLLGLYLFYYFKSDAFLHGIQSVVNTNTQGNVGITDLKKVKISLPPLGEQEKLVEYIAEMSQQIEATISVQLAQIEKLREYKSTLINSAVTGKIKVI